MNDAPVMEKLRVEIATMMFLGKVLLREKEPSRGILHAMRKHAEMASQLAQECLRESKS